MLSRPVTSIMPVLKDQLRSLPKRSDEGRKAGLGVGLTVGAMIILVIAIYFVYKITKSPHSKKRSKKKPKIHTTTVNDHEHIHFYEPGSSSKSKSKSKKKKKNRCGCQGRCQCTGSHGKHSSGQRHGRRATNAFLAEGYEWASIPTPAPDSGQVFAADGCLPPPLPCVGQPMYGPDPLVTDPLVHGESQYTGASGNRYKLSLVGYMKNKHCCKNEGGGCCDSCCKSRTRKCREYRSATSRESGAQLEGWIGEDGDLYGQQPAQARAPAQDTVAGC